MLRHVLAVAATVTFLAQLHADELSKLDTDVFSAEEAKSRQLAQMTSQDARSRIRAANQRESAAWHEVKTRDDWERLRDVRITALRQSLGTSPPVPTDLKVRTTRTIDGDGYRIENLVYESRPGLLVTANLYSPAKPAQSMPGILICHSHHNPKTQSELQDMGMTWARAGCLVLVIDQLGHGERRQHPFVNEKSFAGTFRPSRQDYYFRYNSSLQLYAIGESLVGWMAWDMMRGVDVLLGRPGIAKDKIVLLGAVAGGGDPVAVTGALDPRIAVVGPFNFGGPQPETTYPLPADAETSFNYAGGGSWESTRNLRLSARDGFLPWVIVGSVAERRLIYGHEFVWDRERDPVWARLQTIFGFYDHKDHLTAATGRGLLSGKPPEATHCNNIGAVHRVPIHAALKQWFGLAVPEEYSKPQPTSELVCLTEEIKPQPLHEIVAAEADKRSAAARSRLANLPPDQRQQQLRKEWAKLLGGVEPPEPRLLSHKTSQIGDATAEHIALEVEPNIVVPLVLLRPNQKTGRRSPVVIGIAAEGKKAFLHQEADAIAALLAGGTAVCLPDLRGFGETRPGDGRGRTSASTSISASELMLGRTLVGLRLRDLRTVMRYLRTRNGVDGKRLALWGHSFAPVNGPDRNLAVPWDAEQLPQQAEPLGTLLALLGGLFEPGVRAVAGQGGLVGYRSLLESPFLYVPHDAVIPGALTVGDLADVAAALAPRPLQLVGMVDGRNRRASKEAIAEAYAPALAAYRGEQDRLHLGSEASDGKAIAAWMLAAVRRAQ